MENITLHLLKKTRRYFICRHKEQEVKLLVDELSKSLNLGAHDLYVENSSIHTKFGTDVIYRLVDSPRIVTLKSEVFNEWLVAACHKLGGKWDSKALTWVFNAQVENEVDELSRLYTEDLISVEIEAIEDITASKAPVSFLGFTVARAFGRDTDVKLGDGVVMIEGIVRSGGSVTNWQTIVFKGSRFKLNVGKNLLDMHSTSKQPWRVKKEMV